MNYPRPCITCQSSENCHGTRYNERQRHRTWINTWWLHFNGIYRRYCRVQRPIQERFQYEHPDMIRRYLQNGPCGDCKAKEICDTPCPAYLRWWDARMEWLKGVWGM